MLDFKRIAEYFQKHSVYVFTADVDFAPEWAIQETIDIFGKCNVPLTFFITHPSKAIKKAYGTKEKARHVGIHPWFSIPTMQGSKKKEIIRNLIAIWPYIRCFRSHGFYEEYKICRLLYFKGFKYDSNLCLFLQPYCTPLKHCTGLVRFPVWWEDDIHMMTKLPFKLNSIREEIAIPGLKIFNFHPLHLATNALGEETMTYDYMSIKKPYSNEEWREHVFGGDGAKTFFYELWDHLKKENARVLYLDDLYVGLKSVFPIKNSEGAI